MKILKRLLPIISCIILIAIDQATKLLAVKHLKDKDAYKLIKNVLHFEYTTNTGAAWGSFSGKISMFLVITIIVCLLIIFVYIKTPSEKKYRLFKISLVMMLAGAIGNMIDRVLNGYVHDFIYFVPIDFPIFNIADSYIVVSTILIAILVMFVFKDDDFDYLFKKKGKQ
ncbi:MAG: signal peptidase II [Lachnospira sp.]|nr:signal peptidase II [Lachnospira sp.]